MEPMGSRRGVADHKPAESVPPVAALSRHGRRRDACRHAPLDPCGRLPARRDPTHRTVPPGGVGLRMGIVLGERDPASWHRDPV